MPLITIIVPVYNIASYLPRCIQSILGQECRDYELLLIDDGSTDESGRICDEYALKDNRISVLHKENGGVSSARNEGIDKARGEWIVFIDGDDWIDSNYLNVVRFNDIIDVDILHFGYKKVLCDGSIIDKMPTDEGFIDSAQLISSANWASTSFSYAFRTSSLKKNNLKFPIGMRTSEDRVFIACAVLKSGKVFCIKESHYYYAFTPGSAVNSKHPYSKNRGDILAAQIINKYADDNNIEWKTASRQWFMEMSSLSHLKDGVIASTDIRESRSIIYNDYKNIASIINLSNSSLRFRVLFWCMQNCLTLAIFYEKYILKFVKFFRR